MAGHEKKLERVLDLMKQKGLNGLIIYSNGTRNMLTPSYFQYFAGLRPLGSNNAMIISKSGDVCILFQPKWDSGRMFKNCWVTDLRGSVNFATELPALMREMKIKGPVGVMGSKQMTEDVYVSLSKAINIRPAEDIIEEIAKERTKREVENAKKAARIADVGFQAFLEYSKIGIREYELAAEVGFAMNRAGSDDNFILLSSERHNYAMHTPRDKKLSRGDIVIGEITPVFEGQFIQLCRTIVLGEPSTILVEKYQMLERALAKSLNCIRSGTPASLISQSMNKVISDAGYSEFCYPPYMRARGHGLGVGSVSPGGAIDDNTPLKMENRQVIIVHPNQYLPETGYLACGESVLVTDSGMERLSETKTKLYTKEA